MKFRYKIAQFLSGRYLFYGIDILTKILAIFCVILAITNIVLSIFGLDIIGFILYIIETIIFFWMVYRLLSKNVTARINENEKVQAFFNRIKNRSALKKRIKSERNTHVYKKCPHCKVVLRLPRRSGVHTVNCPRCKNDFSLKVN